MGGHCWVPVMVWREKATGSGQLSSQFKAMCKLKLNPSAVFKKTPIFCYLWVNQATDQTQDLIARVAEFQKFWMDSYPWQVPCDKIRLLKGKELESGIWESDTCVNAFENFELLDYLKFSEATEMAHCHSKEELSHLSFHCVEDLSTMQKTTVLHVLFRSVPNRPISVLKS